MVLVCCVGEWRADGADVQAQEAEIIANLERSERDKVRNLLHIHLLEIYDVKYSKSNVIYIYFVTVLLQVKKYVFYGVKELNVKFLLLLAYLYFFFQISKDQRNNS